MTEGAAVNIPAGVKLDKPLHLVFVTRGSSSHSVATRNIVSLGEGAEATIIEQHVTLGDTAFQTSSVTEMKVADGAKAKHIKLQDESLGSTHLATWAVELGKASGYRGVHLATGAALLAFGTCAALGSAAAGLFSGGGAALLVVGWRMKEDGKGRTGGLERRD